MLSLFAFMAFYIYILQSAVDNSYYKGFTEDPLLRLERHNNGESQYTSHKRPWRLVYVELMSDKRSALTREKSLKKQTKERLLAIIACDKNIVHQFQPDQPENFLDALSSPQH